MPESFSVNQLKTWAKCQKKYEYDYIRKLLWPANPRNFRVGKGVHQLLDYGSRSLPLDPIVGAADADIVKLWHILEESTWTRLPIIASEWGFSLEVAGYWIYGRIDRIVEENGLVCILDWKTGTGIPLCPEEDWQTLIYLYAVYEARRDIGKPDLTPEELAFVYVQAKPDGRLTDVRIPYTTERHHQTTERLTAALTTLDQASAFRLPHQCPDRFCPYPQICGILLHSQEEGEDAEDMDPVTPLED